MINFVDNEEQFNQFILLLFLTSTFIALYIMLHYYGIIAYLHDFGPIISPIGQKNWTSNYISLIFFILFVFFLLENNRNIKIIYFISLLFQYTALMICQSRGIWISIIVSLIIGFYFIYKYSMASLFKNNKKWLITLLSFFILIAAIYSTDNVFNKSPLTVTERALSTFDKDDPSINRRLMIYKITLAMINDKYLLGGGIGSFKYNFLDYQADYIERNPSYIKNAKKVAEAHNEYLQMFSETGLLGLLSFLSILIVFFLNAYHFFITENKEKNKIILLGLILGIICFLIHSMFTFPLHVPSCGAAFFILFALAFVFTKKYQFKTMIINKSSVNNQIILKLLSLLLLVIVISSSLYFINIMVIKPFLAHRYAFCAENRLANNKIDEALIYYKLSLKNNPRYGQMWLNMGALYYNANMNNEAMESLLESKKFYNHQNIYFNLGLVHAKSGNLRAAEEEFQKAIYLEPKSWLAYNSLASLYVYQNEYEKAIEIWKKAIQLGLDFEEKHIFLYYIGLGYQRLDKQEEAYNYFLEALQEAPDDSPIMKDIEQQLLNIYLNTNASA